MSLCSFESSIYKAANLNLYQFLLGFSFILIVLSCWMWMWILLVVNLDLILIQFIVSYLVVQEDI